MNDVRMPIETIREGEKITKVCVEDVYKIINRIIENMDKAHNNSIDIIDSVDKTYQSSDENSPCYEGSLIIGRGVSQPCKGDIFNEALGNEIAFRKAKLNANIKKSNVIHRIIKQYEKLLESLNDELYKITDYIWMDLLALRLYNPDYLANKSCLIGNNSNKFDDDEV